MSMFSQFRHSTIYYVLITSSADVTLSLEYIRSWSPLPVSPLSRILQIFRILTYSTLWYFSGINSSITFIFLVLTILALLCFTPLTLVVYHNHQVMIKQIIYCPLLNTHIQKPFFECRTKQSADKQRIIYLKIFWTKYSQTLPSS